MVGEIHKRVPKRRQQLGQWARFEQLIFETNRTSAQVARNDENAGNF